jgi:hypothetical protein
MYLRVGRRGQWSRDRTGMRDVFKKYMGKLKGFSLNDLSLSDSDYYESAVNDFGKY